MNLCLQILSFSLMMEHLVSADRMESCQKVLINNGRLQGECCIFIKETPRNLQEEVFGLLDSKLTSQIFLQHEARSTEDAGKAIIDLMPLHQEVQSPLGQPPILIIGHHHHHHHQAPPRNEEGRRYNEHIDSHGNLKESGSTRPRNFIQAKGQTSATELSDGDEMINVTTEIGSAAENNTTGNITVVKTILDNRNAIDVPVVECPAGHARDPSGTCVLEFV